MNMKTKHDVLQAHLKKWLACKGNKIERGLMIDELSKTLKMHVKSISRGMKRIQLTSKGKEEKRGRPVEYGSEVNAAFAILWDQMDNPCAENMTRKSIEEYLTFNQMEKDWNFSDNIHIQLLSMSEGTKKLRIATFRQKRGLTRGKTSTISSPLKGMIPIRNILVCLVQTDSVVHCGDMLTADVMYSVGCVDFASYWTDYTCQWNKGQEATTNSLSVLHRRFPVPLLEIHPDTGQEFINYHLQSWAISQNINMTRSEPYKKNDNMCIEERNGSIVRKHLGYARIDDPLLVPICSQIMEKVCTQNNHFKPVRRMVSKLRIGAKWKRVFEKVAKTPFERIMSRSDVAQPLKDALLTEHNSLNPLKLKQEIDKLKSELSQKLSTQNQKKSKIQ